MTEKPTEPIEIYDKCVLQVYYNFREGSYSYDFGDHNISMFTLIGILHMIQNDLDCHINEMSEEQNNE